ncbi:Zn finger-containing GTPase- Activating Protein for ARF [Dinochytrium kinnereticum]|nr:Zn finger-containing GTPase- Activating Protein for ARF [Dinochytrium kinnereticum]
MRHSQTGGIAAAGSNSRLDTGNIPTKSQNEDYFNRMGQLNSSRPADLAPSQGGRYAGFGSSYNPPSKPASGEDIVSEALGGLSLGWSFLASNAQTALNVLGSTVSKGAELAVTGAETLGQQLTENVIKPAAATIRDPDFQTNVSSTISSLQQKVVEGGSRSISFVSSLVSNGQPAGAIYGGFDSYSKGSYAKAGEDSDDGWSQSPQRKSLDWDDWKGEKEVDPRKQGANSYGSTNTNTVTPPSASSHREEDEGFDRWGRPIVREIPVEKSTNRPASGDDWGWNDDSSSSPKKAPEAQPPKAPESSTSDIMKLSAGSPKKDNWDEGWDDF